MKLDKQNEQKTDKPNSSTKRQPD